MRRSARHTLLPMLAIGALLSGCDDVRLLRPSALKQLNPDVVRLVNTLPAVDRPNKAIVGRLFAHGGLSNAERGRDGVFRDEITVPKNEFIWRPAIIRMEHGGELELDVHDGDQTLHMAFMPSNPRGSSLRYRRTLRGAYACGWTSRGCTGSAAPSPTMPDAGC